METMRMSNVGHLQQLWKPGHGAVGIHDFTITPAGSNPAKPAKVNGGFGVSRPPQNASFSGLERENVARSAQLLGRMLGSMSALMVLERSAAEIPVVQPCPPGRHSL